PLLNNIDSELKAPQILVLAPTRELAVQVAEACNDFSKHMRGVNVLALYGGQRYDVQLRALRQGPQIVVGTPGRLLDHLKRGTLDLSNLRGLVLDEADEMLRMGFIEDVETIMAQIPEGHQTALFSATMPEAIRRITRRFMKDPQEVRIQSSITTRPDISQSYWTVWGRKTDALVRFLEAEDFDAAIIFVRTKNATLEVAEALERSGYNSAALNGDMNQALREQTLERLKDGRLDILIATDVAARGLDVERISLVVNYDIPMDSESYVHRIGRTGRAGKSGQSITFVSPNEMGYLQIIENLTKKRMKGLKPASAEEAFQAKKHVALKKIERDFADETIRANFEKFGKDARKLAAEFTPEELAMYILSLTVQDPDSLPEVEIAREKPLPFKPSGNGFGGKAKGGRGGRRGDDRRDRDRRGNGRRDDFKKGSRGNDRFDKEKRYRKDNKKPRNTSSEKQTGFVIRNKGDK
ncbi:MAG: DEAD/DEAH box helicase, partial [Mixta calida]|nr:DEAD/DEAH box helicase [Mixta calida]